MTRVFDAQSMVVLPSLDAGSASALVTEVLQVAKKEEKSLSESILAARDDLAKAEAALGVELSKTLAAAPDGGAVAEPEREEALA